MTLQNYLTCFDEMFKPTESLFRLVPLDRIDWKPTETSFSCGQLMSHIGGALSVYGNGIASGNWGFQSMREIFVINRKQTSLPIEETIEKLNANYEEFKRLLGALTEEEFNAGIVDSPQLGKALRWRLAMLATEHHVNHKAELFMYLKLLGVKVNTGTLYKG